MGDEPTGAKGSFPRRARVLVTKVLRKAVGGFSRAARRARRMVGDDRDERRRTFQDVYRSGLWGSESGAEFFSGVGSRGEAAESYVLRMSELLSLHSRDLGRPLRIVDVGCGDFHVGKALLDRLPGFEYLGCDIVPELVARNERAFAAEGVSFRRLDVVSDEVPAGDVCLVRQVLQHLSNADIQAVLPKLSHDFVYVTEGHPKDRSGPVNPDKEAGFDVRFDWRTGTGRGVELDQAPFLLDVHEAFRTYAPPHEVIVTHRLVRPSSV